MSDLALEHRVKVSSIAYLVRKARRQPATLNDMVEHFHDNEAAEAQLEKLVGAMNNDVVCIDNAQ